ncbi:MAG: hypothetical protein QXJ17_05220 [Nitrososphaeria archaeon]
MNEVVLDTSFLMVLSEKSSKIIEDIERLLDPVVFVVPSSVVEELKRLSKSRFVKKSKRASLALRIVSDHMQVRQVSFLGSVDDQIISYARSKSGVFVATMDSGLRRRLIKENLKCITLSTDKVVLS